MKPKILIIPAAMILALVSCRPDSEPGAGRQTKVVELAGPQTEIIVYSAKVPGYWTKSAGGQGRFFLFLFSREDSFKKGDLLTVEGELGKATAAIFDDESRAYFRMAEVIIFAAWKAEKYKGPGQ